MFEIQVRVVICVQHATKQTANNISNYGCVYIAFFVSRANCCVKILGKQKITKPKV